MFTLLFSNLAFGNGQSTHCWISEQAIQNLPEGELRDLMLNPSNEQQWRNGTMFPDGGYAIGDGYGEISHWEPFLMAYLDWIKTHYSQPWNAEAKEHIAFLMGLGSHGLADQTFDAMYFRRAYQYDADGNWEESLDTSTDVSFIAQTEPQPVPDDWIPMDAMLEIYGNQNHSVNSDTIERGQSLLRVAVTWVGGASQQESLVEQYESDFPWATSNLLNSVYPGSPPIEAEIIASYWQVLWAQLHEQTIEDPVMYAYPPVDTYEYTRSKEDIESHLSVVFTKGIDTSLLTEELFSVYDAEGLAHPIGVNVFYGMDSHVINITPLEDWKEDTDYQLMVTKNVPFRDGTTLGIDWSRGFSTKDQPEEIVEVAPSEPNEKTGCQIARQDNVLSVFAVLGILGMRRRYD